MTFEESGSNVTDLDQQKYEHLRSSAHLQSMILVDF